MNESCERERLVSKAQQKTIWTNLTTHKLHSFWKGQHELVYFCNLQQMQMESNFIMGIILFLQHLKTSLGWGEINSSTELTDLAEEIGPQQI
jgi:hypothetical protein